MPDTDYKAVCPYHSGCTADIKHLKEENVVQWKAIESAQKKHDELMTRINVAIGGIAATFGMLALNLLVEWLKAPK